MPHHFTKSTIEASIWCNKCGKETPWRVADGRRQYCLTCYDKPSLDVKPPVVRQGNLFDSLRKKD